MNVNRRRSRSRSGPRSKKPSGPPPEELHPTLDPPDIRSFREWELSDEVQDAVAAMGITEPTPIQRLAIQPVLDGKDVIAKAETGTGKTLAFGAPMMSKIEPGRATVLGLVLCPTRELAQQVAAVLEELGRASGLKVALVVGGDPMQPQVSALRDGAQVVVGTPGRVLDLYNQRFLSFPWTEFAVLDEADEMLEIGFIDDVKKILGFCPDERQTLLFSATFPPALLDLARSETTDPVEIATAKGVSSVDGIAHYKIKVGEEDRPWALERLIRSTEPDDVMLVFCDRRVEVERLMRFLERTRWSVKALHGGYDQAARFRVMAAFREGNVKVLVATDVASRGLDVDHVTHVVNFSVPRDITDYTHRCGRTGRAGRSGQAITMVAPSEMRRWRELEGRMTWDVEGLVDEAPSRDAGRGRPRGDRDRDPKRPRRKRSRSGSGGSDDRDRPRRSDGDDERPRRPRRRSERDDKPESRSSEERGRGGDRERPNRRDDARDEAGVESQDGSSRPRRRGSREDASDSAPRERARDDRGDEERERPRRERARDDDRAEGRDGGEGRQPRDTETRREPRRRRRGRGGDSGESREPRREQGREDSPRADEPRRERGGRRPRRESGDRERDGGRSRDDDREPRERPQRREKRREDEREGAERPKRSQDSRPSPPSGGFGAGL